MIVLRATRRRYQTNFGADGIAITRTAGKQELKPVLPGARDIPQQFHRVVESRDHHIDPAIVVKIAKSAAPMGALLPEALARTITSIYKLGATDVGEH